ncbi:Nucleoside diphosphate kinase [Sporomusa acidovorans DSM 3132]|uniref:Nucleoside diphosphate kinase n=1 Tax=Sporomusa acidovorans (strain ATCC 49682 / DSM 3132 / Mol) TaxID=1123286 RepID=A0ABZ3J339_SPOA4|nr:nucleoside-diphosphate kinase [Sporomusa acidovorans]OZC20262.1 nucleoside diphosphate kinase [Sporomusa acidovorans DSM 3132]SDD40246.1 nucleoside diphosphate kinase [Sporomusa acidovorans]
MNSNIESTLVLLKPDAVQRKLCGEIIHRFERRGLLISALKLLQLTPDMAANHYAEHRGKPFYPSLVKFITSGPLVAMVLSGPNAVKVVRTMMGSTNPVEALPGTIRGDYATIMSYNIVHGSDSAANATREIAIYFTKQEIIQYDWEDCYE